MCANPCPPGTFGVDCKNRCDCYNGALCDHVSGQCHCLPGFQGEKVYICLISIKNSFFGRRLFGRSVTIRRRTLRIKEKRYSFQVAVCFAAGKNLNNRYLFIGLLA